ncbi:MAG: DNA polymerase III subunit delta [Saccharofermentans sp.]|nr:DNA polymerase III subunit delta [Saccharofermentans sp.]
MIVTLSNLAKRIKSFDDRCFLLYGKEDFYIEKAAASIKTKYLTQGFESMDYIKLDYGGKSVDLEKVAENIELPAWSSLKRVVEVCNFDYEKLDADKTIKLINSIPDSTVVVFRTISIDKRKKKLFEAFDKNGIVSEIDYLDEEKLSRYIVSGFGKAGLTIDGDATESIISRYDSSMRNIDSAVKRISIYASASGINNIDMNIVDELCIPDINGNIFKMMDAVGDGQVNDALIYLDNLIKLKEPVTKIRFMIAKHFRELICAKDTGNSSVLAKRLGLRPFQADKLIRQSKRFSMQKLLKLYELCYLYDVDIKTGKAEERTSLEMFFILATGR